MDEQYLDISNLCEFIKDFNLLSEEEESKMLLEITKKRKILKQNNISLKNINKLLEKYEIEYKDISISAKIQNINNKLKENKYNKEYLKKLENVKKIIEFYKTYKDLEETFISSNIRLVISIARKYVGRGVDFLDLVQEGNIGLKKAFDRYNIDKECKFSTYATWHIRKEVIKCLQKQCTTIKVPEKMYELYYRISLAERELEQKLFRLPKDEDVINYLKIKNINLDIKTLHNIKSFYQPIISLDTYIDEECENTVMDLVKDPKNNINDYLTQECLRELLSKLTLRERIVLILRNSLKLNNFMDYSEFYKVMLNGKKKYADELCKKLYDYLSYYNRIYTLKEIGDLFNVTNESIRQNEANALKKLKEYSKDKKEVYLY